MVLCSTMFQNELTNLLTFHLRTKDINDNGMKLYQRISQDCVGQYDLMRHTLPMAESSTFFFACPVVHTSPPSSGLSSQSPSPPSPSSPSSELWLESSLSEPLTPSSLPTFQLGCSNFHILNHLWVIIWRVNSWKRACFIILVVHIRILSST